MLLEVMTLLDVYNTVRYGDLLPWTDRQVWSRGADRSDATGLAPARSAPIGRMGSALDHAQCVGDNVELSLRCTR